MDLKGAEIRNISNLCKEMNSPDSKPLKVNIPHYQRPYKWNEEMIKNLIKDYFRNAEDREDNKEYFIGSVVLVKGDRSEGRLDVIDGQQRITTIFLLNYLRFLLLRAQVQDFLIRRSSASIGESISKLIDCYSLFGSKTKAQSIRDTKDEIIQKINEIGDLNESQRSDAWDQVLAIYQNSVGLPTYDLSDIDKYNKEHSAKLVEFLKEDTLALSYSRMSYNEKLIEALSLVVLIADKSQEPRLNNLIKSSEDNAIAAQYANAIMYEFASLKESCKKPNPTPLDILQAMINNITDMLENIKFCVIMTGNEADAYTLFEVLNDRSMKVDDLDLIKNLFLKVYCNTSGESEEEIDQTVEEIDKIWGEDIFDTKTSQKIIKLISYLGAIFLTADDAIHTNKSEKFRETIEKNYFEVYFKDEPYTSKYIKHDVKIYQCIKILLNEFGIHANRRTADAITAETNSQKSITYKTLHLLNAFDQKGVIAALTNLILATFLSQNTKSYDDAINTENFKSYVDALKNDYEHKNTKFTKIHNFAFDIWRTSLLAKDYAKPREVVRPIISKVAARNNSIPETLISNQAFEELKKEFEEWTSNWRYNASSRDDIKVKILFCELITTTKNDSENRLKIGHTSINLNGGKLHLDHLDARQLDPEHSELYFRPNDPSADREKTIDSLGNMMLLEESDNGSKSNTYLSAGLEYYHIMFPGGHWLMSEIEDLLQEDDCVRKVNYADSLKVVPNERFFSKRSLNLRQYFLTILSRTSIEEKDMPISVITVSQD